jgi:hypothetical protein
MGGDGGMQDANYVIKTRVVCDSSEVMTLSGDH